MEQVHIKCMLHLFAQKWVDETGNDEDHTKTELKKIKRDKIVFILTSQ